MSDTLHTGLTTTERDAIDNAISRLRGCHALAVCLNNLPDTLEMLVEEEDLGHAQFVITESMHAAIVKIQHALTAADARQTPSPAQKGRTR